MTNTPQTIITVDDKEGHGLSVAGGTYRVLISGKQTGGSFAVIDMLIPPGGGPNPHGHADMQESYYVLDGEIEFKSESGNHIARKGSFVNIPLGGLIHCFKNKTNATAHLLCTVVPAGLEEFFQEIGKPVKLGTFLPAPSLSLEEQQRVKTLAEKYGQKLYPPDYLG